MRTNIVIDPGLMEAAMKAGPYTPKKDAVEAGLRLLAPQAAYREVPTWEGKAHWACPLQTSDGADYLTALDLPGRTGPRTKTPH